MNRIKIFLAVSVAILIGLPSTNAQSNACATATALVVGAAPVCGSTAGGTVEAGEYLVACGAAGANQTVWYKFVATATTASVWIDNTLGGGCPIGHAIYNTGACQPGAGNVISCKNIAAPTDMWHHLSGLTIGNTYLIQILYNSGGPCGGSQTFCISVIVPPTAAGYTAPTVGTAGTYVGSCMVNTCTGNYYDNGGPGGTGVNGAPGNYSNSINNIYRTFCPDAPGMCVSATVNFIDMESGFDFVRIRNGPTQNSTQIAAPSAVANGTVYTATTASGCLTFTTVSDATNTRAGFNITLSCVACAGTASTTTADCPNAVQVCSNASITGASTGPGLASESCSGCTAGGENFSNWYVVQVQTSGNLLLTIDPTVNTDDFDYAIYGPGATCAALGAPIRCSYAATATPGNTGLGNGAVDVSEGVSGDSWTALLPVTAGQIYYLMVNKWDPNPGNGFTLNWTGGIGGSSTATLNCTPLPVELLAFNAVSKGSIVNLSWITATEVNNDYYSVERSSDAENFQELKRVKGAGNSSEELNYTAVDETPLPGVSYYRLKQTDFNGTSKYSIIIPVRNTEDDGLFTIVPNPTSDFIDVTYTCNASSSGTVKVFDYSGKMIMSQDIICQQGENKTRMDLAEQAKGFYFVTFTTENKIYKTKLIKK